MIDRDAYDELLQTYAAEHPWHELDHRHVLELAWREVGGAGGIAEVFTWAADEVESGDHWPMTLRLLHAAGWHRDGIRA